MPKPLIADMAYPPLDDLTCDAYSARIISPAYAAPSGELNATLQYIYHSFNFAANGDKEAAETLKSIAIAEMLHLNLLGTALIRLGAQPVYSFQPPAKFNFYSTKFVAYSRTLCNMLEDDLMGEKFAIQGYERMLCRLKNGTLKALIVRIIEDEKMHVAALKKLLDKYSD